jgi:hypothetical protein
VRFRAPLQREKDTKLAIEASLASEGSLRRTLQVSTPLEAVVAEIVGDFIRKPDGMYNHLPHLFRRRRACQTAQYQAVRETFRRSETITVNGFGLSNVASIQSLRARPISRSLVSSMKTIKEQVWGEVVRLILKHFLGMRLSLGY